MRGPVPRISYMTVYRAKAHIYLLFFIIIIIIIIVIIIIIIIIIVSDTRNRFYAITTFRLRPRAKISRPGSQ